MITLQESGKVGNGRRPRSKGATVNNSTSRTDPPADSDAAACRREFIALMEGLLESFRGEVYESCGDSAEGMFLTAEEHVRAHRPGVGPDASLPEPGPGSLDLLEEVVRMAPIFKRSRFRESALALLSELYTRHYGILDQFKAIEAVEQCYYRLKK